MHGTNIIQKTLFNVSKIQTSIASAWCAKWVYDALYLADSSSGSWNQVSQKQALDVYSDCPF